MLRISHSVFAAQEFQTIFSCFTKAGGKIEGESFQGDKTRALIAQTTSLLRECKYLARVIKIGQPSTFFSSPEFDLGIPSRGLADRMVDLYFQSFESTYRILHIPTFWANYREYWDRPEGVTFDVRLKILLAIAIGSSLNFHGDTDAEFRNMVHRWIHAAQAWLSGPQEKDRLNLNGLQIQCLTSLAREIFSIGGELVWVSMGSLINAAMQIGLHRDPRHLPAMPVLQAELRRRLWATILEIVVQSSLDSATPPRISFDDFDTEAPSNINDNEMDESTTVVQPHPDDSYTSTSMQLFLLKSLPTRLRMLQLLNGLHSELAYVDVLALSSEITDACRACSNFLNKNKRFGILPNHINLLDYLVRRFLIPLHYPFARKAKVNPLFYYSRKVCLDIAMAIISPPPDQSFSKLIAIGGGLFREGFMLAMTVISLELIVQVEVQRHDGTLHSNSSTRELLKQTVKDMMSSSLERIRQVETSIRIPLFLSMVLAQVEAIVAGTECEFKILQGGRDNLEICRDILQMRVGASHPLCSNDTAPTTSSLGEEYGTDFDFGFDPFFPEAAFSWPIENTT